MMVNLVTVGVLTLIFINRALFVMDEHSRLSAERTTDLYMSQVCSTVDYKKLGRHANLCSELEKRLKVSVTFSALRNCVNDVVYSEVTVKGIFTVFAGLSIILMLSNLQQRYLWVDRGLPH